MTYLKILMGKKEIGLLIARNSKRVRKVMEGGRLWKIN